MYECTVCSCSFYGGITEGSNCPDCGGILARLDESRFYGPKLTPQESLRNLRSALELAQTLTGDPLSESVIQSLQDRIAELEFLMREEYVN